MLKEETEPAPEHLELITDTSNLVAAAVNLCHCTRELLGKAERKEPIKKDLWAELRQLTEEAEVAFEKARKKKDPESE